MNAQYRVHVVDTCYTVESPFVITTVVTDGRMGPVAEWFLVVPGVSGDTLPRRTDRFHIHPALVELATTHQYFTLDESCVLDIVAELAWHVVERYIYDQYKANRIPGELFNRPTYRQVEDADKEKRLALYWLGGNCTEDLNTIYRETKCEPLTYFLEVLKSYPPTNRT